MYGLDENGKQHTEWAFTDIDGSPTKAFIIEHHDDDAFKTYFHWAVDLRPEFELFDAQNDPYCLKNLCWQSRIPGGGKRDEAVHFLRN